MSYNDGKASIDAVNRTSAMSNPQYVQTDLGIKKTDQNTQNIISSTFGEIKRFSDAMWYAIGFDPNVNQAYQNVINDPNTQIVVGDKVYHPHPGIGNLQPYNEAGNPAGGAFSLHTLA